MDPGHPDKTHALQPVAVRKVCTMSQLLSENWADNRLGWYMPDATRLAPKAAPVTMVSMIKESTVWCVIAG